MNFISKFTKRDLFFSVVTGLITGAIAWQILAYLRPGFFQGAVWGTAFIVGVPVLWALGVLLGYLLGEWMDFFNQFGKFAAIGFTNAAVDFGILNILISYTGFTGGNGYAGMKAISFTAALLSSYVWNKYWAFNASSSHGGGGEFGKFVLVTLVSFVINVSTAYFVVNYIHPVLGMNAQQWANIGAAAGSAVALIFSFIGFKLAVFRK